MRRLQLDAVRHGPEDQTGRLNGPFSPLDPTLHHLHSIRLAFRIAYTESDFDLATKARFSSPDEQLIAVAAPPTAGFLHGRTLFLFPCNDRRFGIGQQKTRADAFALIGVFLFFSSS